MDDARADVDSVQGEEECEAAGALAAGFVAPAPDRGPESRPGETGDSVQIVLNTCQLMATPLDARYVAGVRTCGAGPSGRWGALRARALGDDGGERAGDGRRSGRVQ